MLSLFSLSRMPLRVRTSVPAMHDLRQRFLFPRVAQTFLNCAPLRGLGYGCDGGVVPDVLEYMEQYGLPDETCL